ncbi:MAG: dihydrofolate reductase [Paludibacter sp.]|nr:dihydrofolate reductase [Paludibacter sp.]
MYKQTIDKAETMYITWIHATFVADAYFPEINFDEWIEVNREDYDADEVNPYSYSFVEYRKKV